MAPTGIVEILVRLRRGKISEDRHSNCPAMGVKQAFCKVRTTGPLGCQSKSVVT